MSLNIVTRSRSAFSSDSLREGAPSVAPAAIAAEQPSENRPSLRVQFVATPDYNGGVFFYNVFEHFPFSSFKVIEARGNSPVSVHCRIARQNVSRMGAFLKQTGFDPAPQFVNQDDGSSLYVCAQNQRSMNFPRFLQMLQSHMSTEDSKRIDQLLSLSNQGGPQFSSRVLMDKGEQALGFYKTKGDWPFHSFEVLKGSNYEVPAVVFTFPPAHQWRMTDWLQEKQIDNRPDFLNPDITTSNMQYVCVDNLDRLLSELKPYLTEADQRQLGDLLNSADHEPIAWNAFA